VSTMTREQGATQAVNCGGNRLVMNLWLITVVEGGEAIAALIPPGQLLGCKTPAQGESRTALSWTL